MSRWEMSGDFLRIIIESGGGEQTQRNVGFRNRAEDPTIDYVNLWRKWNGDFSLSIHSSDERRSAADQLRTAITRREEIPSGDDRLNFHYHSPGFRTIETAAWFQPLMDVINELEPTFASTQTEIIRLINQYQNAPVSQEPRRLTFFNDWNWMMADDDSSLGDFIEDTNIFSAPVAASALPSEEKNAKTLSEIAGFDDKTIPEAFCCAISRVIMDNPVYDPNHPQYKFERTNIERWLTNSRNENPYTRTPLTKEQLVRDEGLKTGIQHFLSLTKKQSENETFCGMRPGFLN